MESVWEYPRPPRVEPVPQRVTVVLGGQTLVRTDRALRVLETSHPPTYYLPVDEWTAGSLVPCDGSSFCEWKGLASYWTVVGGDRRAEAAAWGYRTPSEGYEALTGHVAVYCGRMDECRVGDEVATPQPGGFYGGWVTSWVEGPFKGGPGTAGW